MQSCSARSHPFSGRLSAEGSRGRLVMLLLMICAVVSASASAQSAAPETAVTLRPGDVIRIAIWREEDLSGDFPVDEQGRVVLPLIGEQKVTDVPLSDIRDFLLEQYRSELRNPSIMITPLRRINILGEVNKPGLYEVDPTISLAGAVGLAGGATSVGDLNRIRILRDGEVFKEGVAAGSTVNSADVRSGDQIVVQQRSWFARNSTFVVSLLLSATSILITVVR